MTQSLAPDGGRRTSERATCLREALRKRSEGVPTLSVPEAAALLSVSQEYLYRLVRAGGFPSVHLRLSSGSGRYVIPARAVEELLAQAADSGSCVDGWDFSASWSARTSAGGSR
jgi:excisionase family DNA binding protein